MSVVDKCICGAPLKSHHRHACWPRRVTPMSPLTAQQVAKVERHIERGRAVRVHLFDDCWDARDRLTGEVIAHSGHVMRYRVPQVLRDMCEIRDHRGPCAWGYE